MLSIPPTQQNPQVRQLQARIAALEAINRQLQSENRTLKQAQTWEAKLLAVPASIMSPSHKVSLKVTIDTLAHTTPDPQGWTQLESWKIAPRAGQGKDTYLDNLKYAQQLGIIEKRTERYFTDDGEPRVNLFIKPTELLAHPQHYQALPEQPRNHGGKRTKCPHCGSESIAKKVTLTCKKCGAIIDEKQTDLSEEITTAPYRQIDDMEVTAITPETVNLTTIKTKTPQRQVDSLAEGSEKPVTPPVCVACVELCGEKEGEQVRRQGEGDTTARQLDHREPEHQRAAELLLDIAGTTPEHIRMNEREGKKYYTNAEPLTLCHVSAHLDGRRTYGAALQHEDGTARASCYDADTPEHVALVQEAAQLLEAAGYKPLLEMSPAQKAHLIIIYTKHVNASAAHRRELELAPQLAEILEYWPRSTRNKVRLPAGKYVRPGQTAWCKIYDAHGQLLATDGRAAARVLLEYQTLADLVPEYPQPPVSIVPKNPSRNEPEHRNQSTQPDERHQQKYDTKLWVVWPDEKYLIDLFNAQYSIDDIAERERNSMILADWRGERTASVGVTKDGQHWTDYGASARRPDGRQDGGDAFELHIRKSGRNKHAVLSELGKARKDAASAEILRSARAGEVPAVWILDIITEAGRSVYNDNATRRGYPPLAEPATQGGVHGFSNPQLERPSQPEQGTVPTFSKSGDSPTLFRVESEARSVLWDVRQVQEYDGPEPPPSRLTYCCNSDVWKWSPSRYAYNCGVCGTPIGKE